jgi:formylglycine-generating enzyme required for sulfatase activity
MKKQAITILLSLAGFANSYAQSYPEMVTVEGGTFTMGDMEMEGEKREQPTHQVTLKTFKMAKTETTVAQWRAFCFATSRAMPKAPTWGWIDNHPIVNVNYSDAVAYCDWLAEKLDAECRLPTEAEWEYAARGGSQSAGYKYSAGLNLDDAGWYSANSNNQTHPVAQKKANELGLYDMSGNVFEWCGDDWNHWNSSYADKPEKEIVTLMKRWAETWNTTGVHKNAMKITYNKTRHQYENSECGMYCLYFHLCCLTGTSMEDRIPDKVVRGFRGLLFKV